MAKTVGTKVVTYNQDKDILVMEGQLHYAGCSLSAARNPVTYSYANIPIDHQDKPPKDPAKVPNQVSPLTPIAPFDEGEDMLLFEDFLFITP